MTKKDLVLGVQELMGDNYEVVTQRVTKANGTSYIGLTIREKGSSKAFPTFNVDGIRNPEQVVAMFNKTKDGLNVDANDITSKDYILANVFPVLYNRENNEELLEDSVHFPFADLEVLFKVSVCNGTGRYIVKKGVLNKIGISDQDLYDAAVSNIQGVGEVRGMNDVLAELMGGDADFIPGANMYVIMSKDFSNDGAGLIFDKKVLTSLDEKLGSYYIVPSSRHELIAVPKDDIEAQMMVQIIKEVNATELAPADFLSNNLYQVTDDDQLEVVAA